jgi:hypothetical protein
LAALPNKMKAVRNILNLFKPILTSLFVITSAVVYCPDLLAFPDSLVFHNGNIITGEVKGLQKGVLEIDADYNDQNIKVTWLEVKEIYTESQFLITINNTLYLGRLSSISEDSISIINDNSVLLQCKKREIVLLSLYKTKFSDRFNALIEVGINAARAENLRQFNSRSSFGYRAPRWSTEASFNSLVSEQNEAGRIRRNDGSLNLRYAPFDKWYVLSSVSLLSNTQQKIDLRVNSLLALGRYLLSSNKAYWGVKIGVNSNQERFEGDDRSNNSWEGLLGMEINVFDVSDFNMIFTFAGYSGLSDFERYRADMNFDLKYDLPLDFFVRVGTSLNYDNKPAENATPLDYVFRSGFGWEW